MLFKARPSLGATKGVHSARYTLLNASPSSPLCRCLGGRAAAIFWLLIIP